jgi:phenylalanyl-tRNA synthetase beta chain
MQGRVAVAELALEPLVAAYQSDIPMQSISAYPAIKEDLAVIVDEGVRAAQVAEAITEAGGELLTALRLFDVYRGDQIGDGQKSLAYRVIYQAADHSLTDADAARLRARIMRRLEETISGRLRASGE